MERASRRLTAIVWAVIGLALIAPIAWFYLYRAGHPGAEMRIEALVFFGLVAFFGLQITLRSLWTAVRGV